MPAPVSVTIGISLALLLSLGALYLILRSRPGAQGWTESLRQASPLYLVICGVLICASWFADGLRLRFLAAGLGHNVGMGLIVPGIMTGNFLTLSTPFMMGGAPALVYTLSRGGLTLGQASAVVVLGGISSQLALACYNLIAALLLTSYLPPGALLGRAYLGMVGAYFALICLFVWLAQRTGKFQHRLEAVLGSYQEGATPRWWARPARTLFRLLEDFRGSVGLLTARHAGMLALSFGCALLYFLLYFLVGISALAALRVSGKVVILFAWLVVAATVAFVVPTPGGSGAAELGAAYALGGVVPAAVLPAFIVLWRLFTFHLNLAMGGVAAAVLARRFMRREGRPA